MKKTVWTQIALSLAVMSFVACKNESKKIPDAPEEKPVVSEVKPKSTSQDEVLALKVDYIKAKKAWAKTQEEAIRIQDEKNTLEERLSGMNPSDPDRVTVLAVLKPQSKLVEFSSKAESSAKSEVEMKWSALKAALENCSECDTEALNKLANEQQKAVDDKRALEMSIEALRRVEEANLEILTDLGTQMEAKQASWERVNSPEEAQRLQDEIAALEAQQEQAQTAYETASNSREVAETASRTATTAR